MAKTVRRLSAVVLGVSTLVCALFFWVAESRAKSGSKAPVPAEWLAQLDRLRESYRALGSLHLRASVIVTITTPEGITTGPGSYEYWESGQRYRIDSRTAAPLKLLPDTSISYDGQRFSWFDGRQRILSYMMSDSRNNSAGLPNPLFSMMDFLQEGDDSCRGCRLRLADFDDDERWFSAKARMFMGNTTAIESVITGPTGKQIHHRMRFSDGYTPMLRSVERIEASGASGRIEVNAYDPDTLLPRHLTVTAASPDGRSHLQAWFAIEVLERLDNPSDTQFELDPSLAQTVWDSDTETFLKTPGWSRPVSLKEVIERCKARQKRR